MQRLALATVVALSSSTAFAGGLAEPTMEPTVVAHKTSSSAGGILIPLLILILVAAAASSGGGNTPAPIPQ